MGTSTNNSGGVQGGITNGEHIYFRVAFKPPATIGQAQNTANFGGDEDVLEAKGRHDPCVVPRAVPIVEAMAALTLIDLAMAQLARSMAAPMVEPLPVQVYGVGDDAASSSSTAAGSETIESLREALRVQKALNAELSGRARDEAGGPGQDTKRARIE